jgi:hypothetical protein
MEDIEISARIHLDKLRVVRTDDGWVAGSADEPYLWFVIKVDGSTIELGVPPTAHVDIDATSAAPGNLGPASQGVPAGTTIAIPTAVGTLETTLRGGAGAAVSLTRFATFVVAVAAMEHDETRAQDVIALRSRIIADSRDKLNDELRQIVQEFIDGEIPSAADVEKRLRHQISEDEIEKIVKDFFGELFGQPVNLINHDVFVGYNTDTVVNFPKLLASSLTGIPIDVRLERGNDPDRPRYHLWGAVERTDIQEPPTIGLVRLDDKRLRLCGRSESKRAWVHERSAAGTWGDRRAIGPTALSSGTAIASSADGSRMYVVGRGLDRRMRMTLAGSDDGWGHLFNRKFATGAGVACSSDGRRVYVMATDDDGNVLVTLDLNGGHGGWEVDWFPTGVKSIASPALACSADGRKLFLITLGEDRKLYQSIFDVGLAKLAPKITLPLDSQRFKSAPACACSDDGRRVWFAALGEDDKLRINKPKLEAGETSIWTEFGGEFVSAPALACSPDGETIHITAIDEQLRMRHRYTTDAGKTWPARDDRRWELLRENAAWF